MTLPEAIQLSHQFLQARANLKSRLQAGAADRDRLASSLERGESPTGYRLDWHLQASKKLWGLLVEEARQFNAQHPGDRVSVADMLDVLASATARLTEK